MNKMSRTLKTKGLNIIAVGMCLCAIGAFSFFGPAPAHAQDNCLYAGLAYSHNACRDNQRCNNGVWADDCHCNNSCPAG